MCDKKVSVIVPVYEVESYLHRCVESIVNQTYKNLEIILIDDGSPDKCPQICDEWAAKDSRIRVIHKINEGVSIARNVGLDVSTGEYIGFVDSDDYIESNMYETMINEIEKERADICVCGVKSVWTDKEAFSKSRRYGLYTQRELMLSILGGVWPAIRGINSIKERYLMVSDILRMCVLKMFLSCHIFMKMPVKG